MKPFSKRYFLLIILGLNSITCNNHKIATKDILIVEITDADLGLKITAEPEYRRMIPLFRTSLTKFLTDLGPLARYVLIHMTLSSHEKNDIDHNLRDAIQKLPRKTLIYGNLLKRKMTHKFFSSAVAEMGHVEFAEADEMTWLFYPSICDRDNVNSDNEPGDCPENKIRRDIALIAAEGYAGKKITTKLADSIAYEKWRLKGLSRITYTKATQSPELLKDKLIIIINQPTPDSDMHDLMGDSKISGSEILGNRVLFYNELAAP